MVGFVFWKFCFNLVFENFVWVYLLKKLRDVDIIETITEIWKSNELILFEVKLVITKLM